MKFKVVLFLLCFSLGNLLFADDTSETKPSKPEKVSVIKDGKERDWIVVDINKVPRSKVNSEIVQTNYICERTVVPYFLKKRLVVSQRGNGKIGQVHPSTAKYKITPFCGMTLAGLAALAGYGLYNYFFGQTDS